MNWANRLWPGDLNIRPSSLNAWVVVGGRGLGG